VLIRLLLLLGGLLALPASAALPAPVAQALREAGIPQESVSVLVQQVDKSRPLIDFNAASPVNPASTMKLLTTYAGLELLGTAYTWKTEAYATGELKDGILNGDLIFKGYGDPALTLERFQGLLRLLRNAGLREIRGDLVLDNRWFETATHDPGAFDGEPWRAYNAAPDALLVNFKATQFSFSGDGAANRVLISAAPALPQLQIINRVELRQVPCADWKDRLGYEVRKAGDQVTITFSGNYSITCGEKTLDLSVLDNATYVHALFRELWQEQGGSLRGNFRSGETPAAARRLAVIDSPPLADIIRLINKYSNNVMARQMLLTMGAEKQGSPGNTDKGIRSLREWLAGKQLDFPELVLENGAGLSRIERISAAHLGTLLLTAWKSPVMPELMSSLPVAAEDGTLAKRLKSSNVAGQAHIKTGSLDGVRAMAGYLLDQKGRRWVVVFVVNHAKAGASRVAQDMLLEWLSLRE
jgi:D-alanyl-D-alanine carboxypeptidase/D-alanyl-D-alanine-endopeptidase (penicillin-binding protein 4)